MQFNIPQFIEIKDKIIGPLTMRQFLYILAGIGALAALWFFAELWLFLIVRYSCCCFLFNACFL